MPEGSGQDFVPFKVQLQIAEALFSILRKNGLTTQTFEEVAESRAERFAALIGRSVLLDWCSIRIEGPPSQKAKKRVSPKPAITEEQLEVMTLELALTILELGIGKDILHGSESLNVLRRAIGEAIEMMGYYEIPHRVTEPLWGCYPLWEKVGKESGLPESRIKVVRDWYKAHHKESYVEA